MADTNVAKSDITATNSNGQEVVLVAAGQPIPSDDELNRLRTLHVGETTDAKAQPAPAENKARTTGSTKSKR